MTGRPAAPATVSLLRNRDFQALWISQFLGTVGKEAAEVAYPLLILAITGSVTDAGLIGSVQLVTVGLLSIPGGTLADRMDRRLLLLLCDGIRLALFTLLGLLVLAGDATLPVIFITAIGSSACLGLASPPALAAIKQLVPLSQVTQATAQNQIRPFAATTLGSPIGGTLFGIGRAVPFLATAATFLLSAVSLLLIRRPLQAPQTAAAGTERRRTSEGFTFLLGQPILLYWMIWVVGSNMAFNHTGAFLAVIATAHQRGASDALVGLTLAVAGAGGLTGALIARPVLARLRPSTIFMIAAWLGPAAAVALAVVPGVLPLGVILAVVFARGPICNALFFSYVATLVPDELQGRVLGAVTFLSYLAQPVGIIGIGVVFDHAGPTWVYAAMGAVATLAALPTRTRVIRTLPTPEEAAARFAPDTRPSTDPAG
ncbi:MAG TPA: MFS transporter [Mycobacteriales bacterium]|nr:MFS transporter [Mycobacteriales bacterium]